MSTMPPALGTRLNVDLRPSRDHGDTAVGETPVEWVSTIVLELITETARFVESYSETPVSPSLQTLPSSGDPHKQTGRLDIILASRAVLGDMKARIEELCAATLLGDDSGTASLGNIILEEILEVHSMLRSVLPHLQSSSREPDTLFDALDTLCGSARRWLTKTTPHPSGSLMDTPIESNIILESNTADSVSLSSENRASSHLAKGGPRYCPIEAAAHLYGFIKDSTCTAPDFLSWATGKELRPLTDNTYLIGSVRTLHLYRSRKAPFHHEYTIVSFREEGKDVESWLRFERAARVKRTPFHLQADSFAPIFGGVTLRETVTFALSREALVHNSDELSSLTLDPPSGGLSDSHLVLRGLAFQIVHTTNTYPKYQLFSANCRWFARRILLNVVQWVETCGAKHRITWKGALAIGDRVRRKLAQEPFGGGLLEGTMGAQLREENTLSFAVRLGRQGQVTTALALSAESLNALQSMNINSKRQQHLITYALETHGAILRTSGRVSDAHDHLQRACSLGRSLLPDDIPLVTHTLESYAQVLELLGNRDKEYNVLLEAITLTRQTLDTDPEFFRLDLARFLYKLGSSLYYTDKPLAAISPLEEATSLTRLAYLEDPEERHRESLAAILEMHSNVLDRLGRLDEACEILRESIVLVRELYAENPETVRSSSAAYEKDTDDFRVGLARQLHALGSNLYRIGQMPDAVEELEEALDFARALYDSDSDKHREGLAATLTMYANSLDAVDRDDDDEICEILREAIEVTRELYGLDPDKFRVGLALHLHNLGLYLRNAEDTDTPLDALIATVEALDLKRAIYAANPIGESESLAKTLALHASVQYKIGLADDACTSIREAVDHTREALARNPDDEVLRIALAERLHKLGEYLYKANGTVSSGSGNAQSALEEAISLYRELSAMDDHPNKSLFAATLELYSDVLDDIGNRVEACDPLREAVDITREYLYAADPDKFRILLSSRLHNLALFLATTGQTAEAFETSTEAVTLCRDAFLADPSEYREQLGTTVLQYIRIRGQLGRVEDIEEIKPPGVCERVMVYVLDSRKRKPTP